MKPHTYTYLKKREDDSIVEEVETAGAESETIPAPETSFGKVAYEWNNALLIAAERIWGEHGNSSHQ
ncbi:hypothetical protein L4X63_00670 [Geomonas sp. Red32]|uniref:hypothetical protein n=1 Tax=Geomonas sp. Red32 TaxID=2912856 RepID=UPI00202D037F|nr:hypothetical protein [Geomonas sp. Red32]MCM0080096.1 hypothetical protein [Geomonas sp. Red32]